MAATVGVPFCGLPVWRGGFILAAAAILTLAAGSPAHAEPEDWLLRTFGGNVSTPHAVSVSPDGELMAAGYNDGVVRVWDASLGRVLHQMEGPGGPVQSVAFSPDGTMLLAGGGAWMGIPPQRPVTYAERGFSLLFDIATGEQIGTYGQHPRPGIVNAVAFSQDGMAVLTAMGPVARCWDFATGELLQTLDGHDADVTALSFSPDGSQVLTGSEDKFVRLWDAGTGGLLRTFTGHDSEVRSVAFSPDGTRVLSGATTVVYNHPYFQFFTGSTRLWDAATGGELHRFPETGEESAMSVAFSPDGARIMAGGYESLQVWDAGTFELVLSVEVDDESWESVAFTPDGAGLLMAGGNSRLLRLRDAASGELLRTSAGHTSSVRSVAFSPDGTRAITAGQDSTARLWDVETAAQLHTFRGHTGTIYSAAFTHDGTRILTGSQDGTIRIWNVATGNTVQVIGTGTDPIYAMALSPDGTSFLTGGDLPGNAAHLWNLETGDLVRSFAGHTGSIRAAAFSSDGTRVLTGSTDTTARLWDVDTGDELHVLEAHTHPVLTVGFSPDGSHVLTGGVDRTMRLWSTATGGMLRVFMQQPMNQAVHSVEFSPDGRLILSAGGFYISTTSGGSVAVRDVITGSSLRNYPHPAQVHSAAFSPDGSTVLTGAADGSVRLWDASELPALATLAQLTEQLLTSSLAETSHLDRNEDGVVDNADIVGLLTE